jgi:hypothetical protein
MITSGGEILAALAGTEKITPSDMIPAFTFLPFSGFFPPEPVRTLSLET